MTYDFYATFLPENPSEQEIDNVVSGELREQAIPDIATRIRLLAGIAATNQGVKDYAVSGDRKKGGGYKSLVHKDQPKETPYAKDLIDIRLKMMKNMGLHPHAPDLSHLPPGSWFLTFIFTLAKPWISKDDDPFYVTESVNPVRKDKVFKVPLMAPSSWKGLLRWTVMHTRLALKKDTLTQEKFVRERFVQALLFGDEKGEEPGQVKDFAAYLDALKPEARQEYERLLRSYYGLKSDDPLPHHSGRLIFYPTFFNLIDVEVINPHSRQTKAGTHPIYLECVPAGASGTFSLLYVPFDRAGEDMSNEGGMHLRYLARILPQLFLTYGFSAKRSSGYGVANDEIQGKVITKAGEKPLTSLSRLPQEVKDVAF